MPRHDCRRSDAVGVARTRNGYGEAIGCAIGSSVPARNTRVRVQARRARWIVSRGGIVCTVQPDYIAKHAKIVLENLLLLRARQ